MVTLEALNALAGDCLLLRYKGSDGKEAIWLIDGGPQTDHKKGITVWSDVLIPRLKQIGGNAPLPIALGMVSHADDDHINGIQKVIERLRNVSPANPAPVKFERFWFNSFDKLVGPKPQTLAFESDAEVASLQSSTPNEPPPIPLDDVAGVDEYEKEHSALVMQSIGQGIALAGDLKALCLDGNQPVGGLVLAKVGQPPIHINGAKVMVVGPLQTRIEALRKEWQAALKEPDKEKRKEALQELFLPSKKLDKSITNLSSIVVLVEVDGRKLLLTGDAHGGDVVEAWKDLGLPTPAKLDLLKMPHHGSIRNVTREFMTFFEATHYVFSADGKHNNPDAETVEALVQLHGHREIMLHFTNDAVKWMKPYKVEKNGSEVATLADLLTELGTAYAGKWKVNMRKSDHLSVIVEL
jgi:beta-lactamase superfamily II metal-dependent hydrolase